MTSGSLHSNFVRLDHYRGGVVAAFVDEKRYHLQRSAVHALLAEANGDFSAKLEDYLAHSQVPALSVDPYSVSGLLVYETALLTGAEGVGLGPIRTDEDAEPITSFRKCSIRGSDNDAAAYGEPIGTVKGELCNAELELVAHTVRNTVVGYSIGCDIGVKGATDDARKGYPRAAGFSFRMFGGSGPLPDAELKLVITDDNFRELFLDTKSLSEYLAARNPEKLLPLFRQTSRFKRRHEQLAWGVMLGAACNTARGAEVFPLESGMIVWGFVDNELLLRHPMIEVEL